MPALNRPPVAQPREGVSYEIRSSRDFGKTGSFYWLWELGSKTMETSTSDSALSGANSHCFTAFCAQLARIGFPPTIEESRTVPFALTYTRSFTTPPIPRCFSTTGYCAATFFRILRVVVVSCDKSAGAEQAQQTARQAPRQLIVISVSAHRQTLSPGRGRPENGTFAQGKWGTDKASPR